MTDSAGATIDAAGRIPALAVARAAAVAAARGKAAPAAGGKPIYPISTGASSSCTAYLGLAGTLAIGSALCHKPVAINTDAEAIVPAARVDSFDSYSFITHPGNFNHPGLRITAASGHWANIRPDNRPQGNINFFLAGFASELEFFFFY